MALTESERRGLAASVAHRLGLSPDAVYAGALALEATTFAPRSWADAVDIAATVIAAARHVARNALAAAGIGAPDA